VRAIVIQEPNSFSSESSCVRSLATDNPHPKWADYKTLIVVVTSMILPLLSLLWVNVRSKREILWGEGKLRWMAPAYAAAIALVFLWICEQWFQANGGVLGAKQPHELLFRLRAIEVFSTSSPALGLFILSAAFSVVSVSNCLRYAEASKVAFHLNRLRRGSPAMTSLPPWPRKPRLSCRAPRMNDQHCDRSGARK